MATYLNTEVVKYLCSCEKKFAICRLYICKHCQKLRCIDCVQQEVDIPYCPSCLESMPPAEAKLKKNRCSNCFDCPLCGHTLMTRATSHTSQSPDDPSKTVTKKMYYMACGFCRWTTRDVMLPDQSVATGNWTELENPHSKRISSLLENYKIIAQTEKAERERKKYVKRRNHLYIQEKYGLSPLTSKRKGLSNFSSLSLKDGEKVPEDFEPSLTVDSFDPLPSDIFTQPASLDKTTKLVHRLFVPQFQPEVNSQLHPVHKHLLMRKSLRCKHEQGRIVVVRVQKKKKKTQCRMMECEHNLSKADFNPSSIKFKIQLTALHHVPEIRIVSPIAFVHNKEAMVTLTLSNPSVFNTTVQLLPIENETDTDYCTAKVELPKKELVLACRDEPSMHMYDEGTHGHEFKDDPKLIVFRKGNKIGFVVKVTPLIAEGDVKICFILKHEFRNTTVAALQNESKEPEIVWLEHKVYICLGKI